MSRSNLVLNLCRTVAPIKGPADIAATCGPSNTYYFEVELYLALICFFKQAQNATVRYANIYLLLWESFALELAEVKQYGEPLLLTHSSAASRPSVITNFSEFFEQFALMLKENTQLARVKFYFLPFIPSKYRHMPEVGGVQIYSYLKDNYSFFERPQFVLVQGLTNRVIYKPGMTKNYSVDQVHELAYCRACINDYIETAQRLRGLPDRSIVHMVLDLESLFKPVKTRENQTDYDLEIIQELADFCRLAILKNIRFQFLILSKHRLSLPERELSRHLSIKLAEFVDIFQSYNERTEPEIVKLPSTLQHYYYLKTPADSAPRTTAFLESIYTDETSGVAKPAAACLFDRALATADEESKLDIPIYAFTLKPHLEITPKRSDEIVTMRLDRTRRIVKGSVPSFPGWSGEVVPLSSQLKIMPKVDPTAAIASDAKSFTVEGAAESKGEMPTQSLNIVLNLAHSDSREAAYFFSSPMLKSFRQSLSTGAHAAYSVIILHCIVFTDLDLKEDSIDDRENPISARPDKHILPYLYGIAEQLLTIATLQTVRLIFHRILDKSQATGTQQVDIDRLLPPPPPGMRIAQRHHILAHPKAPLSFKYHPRNAKLFQFQSAMISATDAEGFVPFLISLPPGGLFYLVIDDTTLNCLGTISSSCYPEEIIHFIADVINSAHSEHPPINIKLVILSNHLQPTPSDKDNPLWAQHSALRNTVVEILLEWDIEDPELFISFDQEASYFPRVRSRSHMPRQKTAHLQRLFSRAGLPESKGEALEQPSGMIIMDIDPQEKPTATASKGVKTMFVRVEPGRLELQEEVPGAGVASLRS